MQPAQQTQPTIAAPLPEDAAQAQAFFERIQNQKAPITWVLIGISAVLFALEWYWGEGSIALSSQRMGSGNGAAVLQGEVWRLFSASMLHGSVAHLALNGMALWSFGLFVEKVLGSARFLSIFVLSAFAGSVLSALRVDTNSVGASGGIWGLMLAGAALFTWPKGVLPTLVATSMRNRVWVPVGINAVFSFTPGIDYLAHGGGGLMGFALVGTGLVLRGLPKADDTRPRAVSSGWTTAAVVLGALLLTSVGTAIVKGKPWELLKPTFHTVALEGTSLEIDLPSSFPAARAVQQDSAWTFTWERMRQDGLFVTLMIDGDAVEVDENVFLNEVQKTVTLADGLTMLDEPRVTKLDGRTVLLFSSRFPNSPAVIRSTTGVVGKRAVRLETVSRSDVQTDAWKQLEHELFFNIRVANESQTEPTSPAQKNERTGRGRGDGEERAE